MAEGKVLKHNTLYSQDIDILGFRLDANSNPVCGCACYANFSRYPETLSLVS